MYFSHPNMEGKTDNYIIFVTEFREQIYQFTDLIF